MLVSGSLTHQIDDLFKRICLNLDLTPTQYALAKQRYQSVGEWLSHPQSPLGIWAPEIYPQGSLNIGTPVKPPVQEEFDVDLVCEKKMAWQNYNPLYSLNLVESRLRDHEVYKTMIERKNRCIRLNYKNEFHLDILPACPDKLTGGTCLMVPDREAKEWKPSNPKGYAAWFQFQSKSYSKTLEKKIEPLPDNKNGAVKSPLQRSVQLLKRWRDITFQDRKDLAPISIVLTTLAGRYYEGQLSIFEALNSIVNKIFFATSNTGDRLIVLNPSNEKEDLSEKWDENRNAYDAFVFEIKELRENLRVLENLRGIPKITKILGSLFGEDLTHKVLLEDTNEIGKIRENGTLGINILNGNLKPFSGKNVTAVIPNTFYGS